MMLVEILGLATTVMALTILILIGMVVNIWKAWDRLRSERREFIRLINEIADNGLAALKEGRSIERVEIDLWFCQRTFDLWKKAEMEVAKNVEKRLGKRQKSEISVCV